LWLGQWAFSAAPRRMRCGSAALLLLPQVRHGRLRARPPRLADASARRELPRRRDRPLRRPQADPARRLDPRARVQYRAAARMAAEARSEAEVEELYARVLKLFEQSG